MTQIPSCGAEDMGGSRAEAVHLTIHAFMHTDRLHRAAIERALNGLGLHRTQHRILLFLERHDTAITQRAIAEEFEISPAAVAVTLRKLEEAGYVERRTAPADGRCKAVTLTEAGREILRRSHNAFTAVDLSMFSSLSDEELATFRSVLSRIGERLRPEGDAKGGTK